MKLIYRDAIENKNRGKMIEGKSDICEEILHIKTSKGFPHKHQIEPNIRDFAVVYKP